MLFSSTEVAKQINDMFEPAWESVRPVPMVSIDFGNGAKITRTLHGNIATYVCTADGKVIDVLPGIYAPYVYTQRLAGMASLHALIKNARPDNVADKLQSYHAFGITSLKQAGSKPGLDLADMGKAMVENPLKRLARLQSMPAPASPAAAGPWRTKAEEIAGWKELADDTRINETTRRLQIHTFLAGRAPLTPANMVKWLYREVLHADLDDPYLGLSEVLFKNYPFAQEDAGR